ncbi:MAG TPA: preprotein translocase subunit SecY [Candidatus Saccharimonadales bacterium]|nr:preprotein translocase subunit SecY [Candidatus Saccharimonadales bacterium]
MNWKLIWKSLADADMRKKILAVLGIVIIFRILAHIPIPISDPQNVRQVLESLFTSSDTPQFLSFLNVLSGGALANFSIMLVGLGPYINASIIMQLLTRAVPKLETLNKEGEYGRKKINQMTRMLTLPLAIMQSVGAIYLVKQQASQLSGLGDITANSSLMQWVLMVAALTGGSMILMWLGELITEQNIGNGISLLITVGIVSTLPASLAALVGGVFNGDQKYNLLNYQIPIDFGALKVFGIIAISVILAIVAVVKLNEAARRLTVHYAKRIQGNRTYGGVTTVLPVKLIGAGVVPIIFAVAFLSVPTFIGQILTSNQSVELQQLGSNLVTWFQTPSAQTFVAADWHSYIYPVTYFALVFLFTFFYTNITFNAKDISENLQKQGGFIADVRSGPQTEKYLSKVVNRLTLFGGIAIALLAVVPIAGEVFLGNNLAIGGTSVLILVSVSLETLRKVESQALMITYSQYDGGDFFQEVEAEEKAKRRLFRRRK